MSAKPINNFEHGSHCVVPFLMYQGTQKSTKYLNTDLITAEKHNYIPQTASRRLYSIIPRTSMDKMLECMMMQMLKPNQTAAQMICCNCFKVKKKESRRRSNACNKHSKHRQKRRKSCLKTIICLTKMAKNRDESQSCSCDPCFGNVGQDTYERFCSKCGQLLQGLTSAYQYVNQPDLQCATQLQRCQQECKDIGVQVNADRKEPLSVRIKVCPCPNVNSGSQEDKLHRSVSLPELSSTNPKLVEEPSSVDLASSTVLHTEGINERTWERPVNVTSIKKLALNMAKARLVEEAGCWERAYARRYLQQNRQQVIDERVADEPSNIDQRKSIGLEFKRRSFESLKEGQVQTAPTTPSSKTQMVRGTYLNYNQSPNMDLCNEYLGSSELNPSYASTQGYAAGCCAGTDVYCYSPENGPITFGNHCEHACTCNNFAFFRPNQFSGLHSGHQYQDVPHQREFGIQRDKSRPDPYNTLSGSFANCHPCR